MKWSLCMIVRNEEEVLARCLESAHGIADELVLVDTGSSDHTKEIARRYTSRVLDYTWADDFAAARNFALDQAEGDYLFWLDADDVLPEESRQALIQLKQTLDPSVDVVMLPYQVAFDPAGKPTFFYDRERIFRNSPQFRFVGRVHEVVPPSGKVIRREIPILHKKIKPGDPDRNLRIFEKILDSHTPLDGRQQFYYGRELYFHTRYEEAEAVFQDFLRRTDSWTENRINACHLRGLCLELLNRPGEALSAFLESLQEGIPRAELCCDLGRCFLNRGDYPAAAFWYEQAASRTPEPENGGFFEADCYGYIPQIQLCVCYDRMGYPDRAEICNEKAAEFCPDSAAVAANRMYFQQKRQQG